MVILEKLPKLRTLKLREDSYLGKKMQVSTSGFPQLEVLQLSSLGNWKRLIIEKGGMSKLTHLQIFESVLDMMDLLSSSICRRQISLIHIHIILAGFLPCLGAPNWRYAESYPTLLCSISFFLTHTVIHQLLKTGPRGWLITLTLVIFFIALFPHMTNYIIGNPFITKSILNSYTAYLFY